MAPDRQAPVRGGFRWRLADADDGAWGLLAVEDRDRVGGHLFDVVTWMWGYLDMLQTRLALSGVDH